MTSRNAGPASTSSTTSTALDGAPPVSARDWARFVAPGLIWGASFVLIAESLEAVPAVALAPLRLSVGFAVLLAVPGARRRVREPRDRLAIALLGIVWMAAPATLFSFAGERVASSVAGMLDGAPPLITAVAVGVAARAMPSRRQLQGLALGLAGVVAIALPTVGEGRSSAVGVALVVVATVCYGFALPIAAPLQARHGALPVILRAQFVAVLVTVPPAIPALGEVRVAWWPLACAVVLGVGGTALAYVVHVDNAGRFGSVAAGTTIFLIPAVAVVLGAMLRGEPVHPLAAAGGIATAVGAYLTVRTRRHDAVADPRPAAGPAASPMPTRRVTFELGRGSELGTPPGQPVPTEEPSPPALGTPSPSSARAAAVHPAAVVLLAGEAS